MEHLTHNIKKYDEIVRLVLQMMQYFFLMKLEDIMGAAAVTMFPDVQRNRRKRRSRPAEFCFNALFALRVL